METIKAYLDFYGISSLFDHINVNKLGQSCAFSYVPGGAFRDRGVYVYKPKGKVNKFKNTETHKFNYKKVKGNLFETVQTEVNNVYSVGKREAPAYTASDVYSFSLSVLSYMLGCMRSGVIKIRYVGRNLEQNVVAPAANKKVLIQLRKEFRAMVKGKTVAILYSEYHASILKEARERLGLFRKKPVYTTTLNNLNHPGKTNYLTLEVYQY